MVPSGVSQAISLRLGRRRLHSEHRLDQGERVDRSSRRDVYTSVDDPYAPTLLRARWRDWSVIASRVLSFKAKVSDSA